MDYFDTAKKYRNKRIKKFISILINILVLSVVAIIAWQVGVRDRNNIVAVHSSELIRIANEFKELNETLEKLKIKSEKDSILIKKLNIEVSNRPDSKLNEIIKLSSTSISKGVPIEQIKAMIRSLDKPSKCIKPIRKELNVITPIYSTNSHEISLFGKGMFILAEGQANIEKNNVNLISVAFYITIQMAHCVEFRFFMSTTSIPGKPFIGFGRNIRTSSFASVGLVC